MKRYSEIVSENMETLVGQVGELDVFCSQACERSHALATIRLSNCPGYWESEIASERAKQLCLNDIKEDFLHNGLEKKLERFIIRKAIETMIVILQSYLKHEYGEEYFGAADGAEVFGGDLQTCASEAQRWLNDSGRLGLGQFAD